MSLFLLQGAVEEGLIYALVALGLFISYNILKIADMTTDGSFVLGAAVTTMLTMSGHPILGLVMGTAAGALAGLITAVLQTRLGVPSIVAGIVSMTGLYSVNLLIQGGKPTLTFGSSKTIFTILSRVFGDKLNVLLTMLLILVVIAVGLILFFKTHSGLSIRATGDNQEMVQASSINPKVTITVGLCMSNGLIALSGALFAQKNLQSNINIGTGVVVIGLASFILGNIIFRKSSVLFGVLAAIVGAVIYRIIYTLAVELVQEASYFKLFSAFIIAIVISYPTIKSKVTTYISRRKEGTQVANPK